MHKYQFHIAFNDKANTAASKAVQDCKSILSELGYQDASIEDINLNDRFYFPKLLSRVVKFFFKIKPNSLVAIQYPLLSGNSQFKYFIRAARAKGIKFFCVVHDVDDLRNGMNTPKSKDVEALNSYDNVIVHNDAMKNWLQDNGLTSPVLVLHAFDYLSVVDNVAPNKIELQPLNKIAFAGNLSKSPFIYTLDIIDKWEFNLYGPNYSPQRAAVVKNICWHGSLSPDEILTNIRGAFGLVWDGEYIDRLDADYGNYLKYNYPHKLSLYLAAGLPVIAPRESAISSFIKDHGVGILVDDLIKLQDFVITKEDYQQMRENVRKISNDLRVGKYFATAVAQVETEIFMEEFNLQANSILQ
ncbi:hypothetical protein [Mucilaginibacter sp. HD30]